MIELQSQLRARAQEALASLAEAHEIGDMFAVQVQQDEVAELVRIADEHGLTVPELRDLPAGA